MKNNSIYLLLIPITISFTILLSNNISFFSSYSQNTTITTKTGTINTLNLSKMPATIIKVDDIDMGYKRNGTGPPILLITGFSASMNNWNPTLISNLSKNHTVI